MSISTFKGAFSAGELSPSLYGHVELARWHMGASVARNMVVNYKGGLFSRAGTAKVGICKQAASATSYPPRNITFDFNIFQSYILEFGDQYMRVVADGGYVTESPVTITGITQGNPAVVTTATAHDYADGDWVFISSVLGMTQVDGRTFIIANVTTNTFELLDEFGDPVDATNYDPYVSGGSAARIYTLETPYAAVDLPYLKYTQSADVMSLTCVNLQTRTEYAPQELTRLAADNWTIAPPQFASTIAPPSTCAVTASVAWTTGPGPAAYGFRVTAVAADGNESVASPIGMVRSSVDIAGQFGTLTVTWAAVPGAVNYNIYRATPDYANVGDFTGQLFGYVGSSRTTSWKDTNIIADFTTTPPLHTNPFAPGTITNIAMVTTGATYSASATVSIVSATGTGFIGFPIIGANLTGQRLTFAAAHPFSVGDFLTQRLTAATGTIVAVTTLTVDVALATAKQFVAHVAVTNAGNVGATPRLVASVTLSGSGSIVGVDIEDGGQNYLPTDTVVFTDGTGSGATATLVVGPQDGTYPGVVDYFQQRRAYAATLNNPDTYFMSQPGRFLNFDSADPPIDSDAIIGSPWAKQVNGIQWLLPMPGGLIVATGKDAWQLSGTGGPFSPVTPAQQQAQQQESIGYSPFLHPLKISSSILFGQSLGGAIREINYNFYSNIYTGKDITVLSSHLFDGKTLTQWAWAQEPYKVVWGVRSDGKLLSLTYIKEEEVSGWTRHDTNGIVASVASASEPPVNAVYLIVKRYVPAKLRYAYIQERMDNRLWPTVEDCWCVDSGAALAQPTPDATLTASRASPSLAAIAGAVLLGGSGYTNPTGRIVDPTGAGAIVSTITVVAGAITAYTINPSGANYSSPTIVFSDATGTGAVAEVTTDMSLSFAADADVFAAGDVGSVIRCGGGIATITEYVDARNVNAQFFGGIDPNATPPRVAAAITAVVPDDPDNRPIPFPAGNWTMTVPVASVSGLGHLDGMTVTGLADGKVVPPTLVQHGMISLTDAASSITLGLPFIWQAQSMHADIQGDQIQGKRKRIVAVTARLANSRGVKVGQDQPIAATLPNQAERPWNTVPNLMTPIDDLTNSPDAGVAAPLFTGDKYVTIVGDYQTQDYQASPGMVAVMGDLPLPGEILAFVPILHVGDSSDRG